MDNKLKGKQKQNQSVMPMGRGGMGGGHMNMMGAGKAKNFKGTLKTLISYLRPFWNLILLVIVLAILSTVFAIVSPKILGQVTNRIFDDYIHVTFYNKVLEKLPKGYSIPAGTTGEQILKLAPKEVVSSIPADQLDKIKSLDFSVAPQYDFSYIGQTILLLVGLYLLSGFFSYLQGWIMSKVSQDVTFQFRKDISEKLNNLPLRYFDTKSHGDILSRVTNDVDTISQSLNQSITQIITSVATILGILIMMLSINLGMTFVALLILPVSLFLTITIVKRSQGLFKKQQDTLGKLNGHIEEMYSGHNVVKVFNGEKRSLEIFDKINKELYTNAWKSQFFSGLMFPIMNIIGNLGYVAIAVLGGYLAINGTVNIGDIQAFIQYLNQFTQPILQTANIANVLQGTIAAAERVFEFLVENEEVKDAKDAISLDKIQGNVEFENVQFGYDKRNSIINGFSQKIKSGQLIAIVGPTGAGKTTLVNLLMRFYDVDEGSIKIDGVDIRNIKRANLRSHFGMVLQDAWLFNGTVRENIAYANRDATDEQIEDVAESAHVSHFIHSLPKSYDFEINEEADNISQGERQLLTIARAMLANPAILILDEATSSVDTRTESLIQKAMENLMKDRTSFVIAHRLSTIKNADLILVLNEGNIVEQGTHTELLSQNGFYANLYNSQFNNI